MLVRRIGWAALMLRWEVVEGKDLDRVAVHPLLRDWPRGGPIRVSQQPPGLQNVTAIFSKPKDSLVQTHWKVVGLVI